MKRGNEFTANIGQSDIPGRYGIPVSNRNKDPGTRDVPGGGNGPVPNIPVLNHNSPAASRNGHIPEPHARCNQKNQPPQPDRLEEEIIS
ncbi:MAG: hypothetical protein JWM16_4369 [Verrucomicrobiales bacterium]|nr:hypothetical protein [Verrucomicrobiales bacterium]